MADRSASSGKYNEAQGPSLVGRSHTCANFLVEDAVRFPAGAARTVDTKVFGPSMVEPQAEARVLQVGEGASVMKTYGVD